MRFWKGLIGFLSLEKFANAKEYSSQKLDTELNKLFYPNQLLLQSQEQLDIELLVERYRSLEIQELRFDINVAIETPLFYRPETVLRLYYRSETGPKSYHSVHFLYDIPKTSLPSSNETCDVTEPKQEGQTPKPAWSLVGPF